MQWAGRGHRSGPAGSLPAQVPAVWVRPRLGAMLVARLDGGRARLLGMVGEDVVDPAEQGLQALG